MVTRIGLLAVLAGVMLIGSPAASRAQDETDLKQLREKLQKMQRTLDELSKQQQPSDDRGGRKKEFAPPSPPSPPSPPNPFGRRDDRQSGDDTKVRDELRARKAEIEKIQELLRTKTAELQALQAKLEKGDRKDAGDKRAPYAPNYPDREKIEEYMKKAFEYRSKGRGFGQGGPNDSDNSPRKPDARPDSRPDARSDAPRGGDVDRRIDEIERKLDMLLRELRQGGQGGRPGGGDGPRKSGKDKASFEIELNSPSGSATIRRQNTEGPQVGNRFEGFAPAPVAPRRVD